MKRFAFTLIIFVASWLGMAHLQAASSEIENAKSYGAKGQVTLHVVDSTGNDVTGAAVLAGFYNPTEQSGSTSSSGLTDKNGLFTATGKPTGDMQYQITKEGYYKTEGSYWFYRQNDPSVVKDGRWQPWNPTNTVVLKEIRKPVPMFAKYIRLYGLLCFGLFWGKKAA